MKEKQEIKVTRCSNLSREMQKAAILFKKDMQALRLEILNVYTVIMESGVQKELGPRECEEFFSSKRFEEERFAVSQLYDCVISVGENLQGITFEMDEYKSRLFLIAQDEVYESLFDNLQELHRQINAYQAFHGLIFKHFSPFVDEERLKDLLQTIDEEIGGYKRLCIARSEFYQPLADSYFSFTLQKAWDLKHKESLENSSYAVCEGSEVGRLFKSRVGRNGKNLLGEFVRIEKREPDRIDFGALEEDFGMEDMGEYLLYRALKNGFAGLNSSGLLLIKNFALDEVDHRNIGNLLGGIECGFDLSIKTSSPDRSAIGAQMRIEAHRIVVLGDVDQNTLLRAKECKIAGSTHQGTEICAEVIEIDKHKGLAKGQELKVKLCEGGKIECQSAEIQECIGSEIACRELKINNLYGHNKIGFCSQVEIVQMSGGNNNFRIDSSSFYEYREQIQAIHQRYHKSRDIIEKLAKIYQKELQKLKKTAPAVEHFKAIDAQNAQRGIQTQSYMLSSIDQYNKMFVQIKSLKEKIEIYQQRSEAIKAEFAPILQLSLEAKILCHGPWVGENQVECVNIIDGKEERLVIEDGERVNVIVDARSYKPILERK